MDILETGFVAEKLSDGSAMQGNRDVIADGSHNHMLPIAMLDALFDSLGLRLLYPDSHGGFIESSDGAGSVDFCLKASVRDVGFGFFGAKVKT